MEGALSELRWQEQNVSVISLVIDYNLGWEWNPKGCLLHGKRLSLSTVSTYLLFSGTHMIPTVTHLSQVFLWHCLAALPNLGLFISPLVSAAPSWSLWKQRIQSSEALEENLSPAQQNSQRHGGLFPSLCPQLSLMTRLSLDLRRNC